VVSRGVDIGFGCCLDLYGGGREAYRWGRGRLGHDGLGKTREGILSLFDVSRSQQSRLCLPQLILGMLLFF
jgi:hypothetical protein